MTDAPSKLIFAGQAFDELPDRLVLPLPRSFGLSPTAPQHSELALREPTEGEVQSALGKERAKLISLVSGMPEELIRQLPVSTVNVAERYLAYFVAEGAWTPADRLLQTEGGRDRAAAAVS